MPAVVPGVVVPGVVVGGRDVRGMGWHRGMGPGGPCPTVLHCIPL